MLKKYCIIYYKLKECDGPKPKSQTKGARGIYDTKNFTS